VRPKWIIGAVVIIAAAILLLSSFNESLTAYVSLEDARSSERRVQVVGEVVREAVHYNSDSLQLQFRIKDETGDVMDIVYAGAMPGNFDQADKVVCKGKFQDGRFEADELLLKCPSKYQGESN